MERLKRNFLRTVPVLTGYMVLGMGFGIVLHSKGYGLLWSLAMSMLIYGGSMQYAAIDLLSAGASVISFVLTTLMVQARHLFYGISMLERYRDAGAAKSYLIFGLTDETYSIVSSDPSLTDRDLLQITLMDQIYWVAGSVLGSVIGTVVPWDFAGVDFALTALFVSILAEQWLSSNDHVPALIGLGCSAACLLIFGPDSFLIPAMLTITAALTLLRSVRKEKADD